MTAEAGHPQVSFHFDGTDIDGNEAHVYAMVGAFALSRGIDPSIATIVCSMGVGENLPVSGTLTISDGETTVTFPDCRSLAVDWDHTVTDTRITIELRDRRWKLPYLGTITREFNRRDAEGNLETGDNKKTVRKMAEILFDAMGETVEDDTFSGLPVPDDDHEGYAYPYVEWEKVNYAEALDDLCQRYSAHMCLGLDNKLRILKYESEHDGESTADEKARLGIKTNPTSSSGRSGLVDIPGKIKLFSGHSRYQKAFDLEAMGYNPASDTWQPIAELGYKPVGGFTPGIWKALALDAKGDDKTAEKKIARWAKKTLFRCYRLKGAEITIDGVVYSRQRAIERALPYLVEQGENEDGEKVKQKPYCTGDHATVRGLKEPASTTSDADEILKIDVTRIDPANGIIWLSQPAWSVTAYKIVGADIKLVCAYKGERSEFEQKMPDGIPDTIKSVVWDEAVYDINADLATGEQFANEELTDQRMYTRLLEEALKYDNITTTQKTRTYSAIEAVGADGDIAQVTWGVSSTASPVTTISWGVEHAVDRPNSAERAALREQAKALHLRDLLNAGDPQKQAEEIPI